MATPLAHVPGLAGYLASQQNTQQQEAGQLQQAGQVLSLQDAIRKQAAAQQATKLEASFRQDLAALGPNPTQEQLASVGAKYADPKTLLTTQQSSLDRQQAARERAEQAAARFEQTSQYQQMMHEWRMGQAKTAEARAAEVARHNQAQEALSRQIADSNAQLKALGIEVKEGARQDKNVQALGTALERAGLNESDAVLRGVEDALKKTPNLAEYISGPKSLLPDLALSSDITAGRQAVQKLFNITLKTRSGAAVTIPEFERLKAEFASGAWKRPEQFKRGIEQAREIIRKHFRGVAAGYGEDALKTYNENLRRSGGTPILEVGEQKEDPLGIRK